MFSTTSTDRCEVSLDEAEGVVRMTLVGAPTGEQLREAFVTLRTLLATCRPRLLLIDVKEIRKTTDEMRRVLGEEAKSVEFDRQAITGIRPAERVFARIVAKVTGKSDRMRFFAAEAEGLRWLKEIRSA